MQQFFCRSELIPLISLYDCLRCHVAPASDASDSNPQEGAGEVRFGSKTPDRVVKSSAGIVHISFAGRILLPSPQKS